MRNHFAVIAAATILLGPAAASADAQTVDQSNYVFGNPYSQTSIWVAQSFRPTANNSVGAGFVLDAWQGSPVSGTMTVELWTDIPSNGGASEVASGSTLFSLAAGQRTMVDVFWSAVAVNPGTQYFLAMNAPGQGNNLVTWASTGNQYANGGGWANSSANDRGTYSDFGGFGYDVTFEEFSTTAPEPTSLVLVATGVVLVASRRRRTTKR